MNQKIMFFSLVLLLLLVSCPSMPSANRNDQTQQQQAESVFYTGNGGNGKSITILSPRASGLSENQNYLPDLVQGEFVSNFTNFSAIKVLDRANLDEQYAELLSGYYDDNAEEGWDLGHLPPTDYLMGGTITRTATGYALQMRITSNADKTTVASYSGTFTFAELDNLTGIRRASLDLLQKVGVEPTDRTRTVLTEAASTNHVNAQTAQARGFVAERKGNSFEASFYLDQAVAFDPSLLEAASRSSILTASISSGHIGEDTRDLITMRRNWIALLTETENSIYTMINAADPPYRLFYSTDIEWGTINYQAETRDASIQINLHAIGRPWFGSMERAVQAIYDGLNATGRKSEWDLAGWPGQGLTRTSPFASANRHNISVVFELVNARNQVIGRQTVNMRPSFNFIRSNNRITIDYKVDNFETVNFRAIKASDITDDRMTIRIVSVNDAVPENSRFNIMALSPAKWQESRTGLSLLEIKDGAVMGINRSLSRSQINQYSVQYRDLVIPSELWGEPTGISSISAHAFHGPYMNSIIIPGTVTSIGVQAFVDQKFTSITIGENVELGGIALFYFIPIHASAFSYGFDRAYKDNGQKAGTYTYDGHRWNYQP